MTDANREERMQAVQAVLDRLNSYQESAPEGTVEKEAREALAETDLQLSEAEIDQLVDAVEKTDGPVQATDVLG